MTIAFSALLATSAALLLAGSAHAEPVTRAQPSAGSVIARKSGEEVRFVDVSNWRFIDLKQDVVSGDVLRTNATGQLAILFADRTQVRLGRNTALLVKDMKSGGADTGLELQTGTLWARAERGGQGLTIDTPAAAAAIRGTDWTLSVGPQGQTSLTVLDGVVELSNAQGSVRVTRGEGAVAAIGQAPRKVIIVNSSDREQMLYYLELRDAFPFLPVSPLPHAAMRQRRAEILARPADRRSAEDWLTLAEVELTISGRQQAVRTLDEARRHRLDRRQQARAQFLEAMIAGAERRYGEAATLFAKAAPNLDRERRSVADYGGYFARSLADPDRVETPPANPVGPYAAVAEAFTVGFRDSIPATIEGLKRAEARYPDDALLPAVRAQVALVIGDRDQALSAIVRSLSLDPAQATALQVKADYDAEIRGDLDGALSSLQSAVASEPGNASAWNALGLLQSARTANREAEAAFRQAIALDPASPLSHANLAGLYLDQLRVADAKREIDKALDADPGFDIALITRGRYHLQTGETDKALDDLLAGSTANPAYAQAQLVLAAAHYAKGERLAFDQALDNADRLDPNDPAIASVRTSVAISDYDAEGAIRNAQDYLRRARLRGGDFGSVGANQEAGSVLNDAFRFQGLNAWGQYYGDIVFDPFTGTSYLDQTVRGSVYPFANLFSYGGNTIDYGGNDASYSSFIKGLMLDPHMLAASERRANLLRSPFFETSLGIGLNINAKGSEWLKEGQIQGYSNLPFPVSVFGNLEWEDRAESRLGSNTLDAVVGSSEITGGNAYVTASPTPDDRIVAYVNSAGTDTTIGAARLTSTLPITALAQLAIPIDTLSISSDGSKDDRFNFGLGWSHTFAYENVLNMALFSTDAKSSSDSIGGFNLPGGEIQFDTQQEAREKNLIGAVGHIYGLGDLTLRSGIEGGRVTASSRLRSLVELYAVRDGEDPIFVGALDNSDRSASDETTTGIAYLDALYEVTPALRIEAALFGRGYTGGATDVARLEPRAGIAWEAVEGQWLRLGYLREGSAMSTPTLSPVGVVALQSNQIPLAITGYTDTFAARWDAQWTDRFFTAVDYQHQDARNLSISDPLSISTDDLVSGDVARARIDRASVTGNLALGHGFGLSATYARATSENRDVGSAAFGGDLTYVPRDAAQVAVTFVHPIGISATVAGNYTGSRASNLPGDRLGDYWTIDANLTYETPDKRAALELAGYNLADEDFYVSAGTPGWGRTVKAMLKVRF